MVVGVKRTVVDVFETVIVFSPRLFNKVVSTLSSTWERFHEYRKSFVWVCEDRVAKSIEKRVLL